MTDLYLGILCSLTAAPAYVLYLLPFWNHLESHQKPMLILSGAAALLINSLLCIYASMKGTMGITFYKRDLLAISVALLLISLLIIHGYYREQVFVSGLVVLVFLSTYAAGAYIMNLFAGPDITDRLILENIIGLLLFCAFFPLFARLVTQTVTPFLGRGYGSYWKTMWLFPVIMFVGTNFATRMNTFITTVPELIGRICTIVATFMIAKNVAADAQRQMERKELLKQVGQQKEHYETLARKVKAERRQRHDFKHQLAAVQAMVKEGRTGELLRYCSETEKALSELSDIPYTGNPAADSVLYHYASIASDENISFSVSGGFGDTSIPDSDIICLLGNALDNAVTGCRTIEEGRYVDIAVMNRDGSLLITVDNSFDGVVLKENGRIYSRKRNHEEGIGIASMKEIVEKYEGLCRFRASGRKFEASFLLNLPPDVSKGTNGSLTE